MSIIVFFSTKITSIGLVNMTLATISRDLVELIQLVTGRDEQVTISFIFQRRISDGNKLIQDILDAVEFCDKANRIFRLISGAYRWLLGVMSSNRRIFSFHIRIKPSFVPRQLESSLDVVRFVMVDKLNCENDPLIQNGLIALFYDSLTCAFHYCLSR